MEMPGHYSLYVVFYYYYKVLEQSKADALKILFGYLSDKELTMNLFFF